MVRSLTTITATGLISSGLILSTSYAAEGTRLIGTGPVQVSTAGAGVASAQNSSWLSLNPAALVDISDRADVSTDIIEGQATMTPKGVFGNTAAGHIEDDVIVYAPAATAVLKREEHTIALGFYTVSGLAIAWPASRTSIAAAGGGYDRRGEQSFVTTSAAYARQINKQLSAALALNFNYVTVRSDSITTGLVQTAGTFDLDTAMGGGFSLSLLQKFDQWRIGATYTSRQWVETLDKYRDAFVGTPDQPQVFQIGVSWQALPWLETSCDYRYIDWSAVDFYGEGLQWRDQHIFKLAGIAELQPGFQLRAGVSYGRSPITESNVFINGLSPLISEWHATIGAGWTINETWDAQLTYLHAFKNTLTDNGADVSGAGVGTEISLEVNSIILGIGCRF